MPNLQPYEHLYQFPTSLPAQPSDLTHSDFEQIHEGFANHPSFVRRKAVTIWVCLIGGVCVAAKIVAVGFNGPVAAVCCGVAFVGYLLRPAQRGTQQCYPRPDMEPPTVSQRSAEQVNINIVNNVTVIR